MKYRLRHTLLSWFLLILMSGYVGSVIAFTHIHTIDGVRIVHSHPFKDAHHEHTPQQTVLFHELSHLDVVIPPFPDFEFQLCLSGSYDYGFGRLPYISAFSGSESSLRAPPVFL